MRPLYLSIAFLAILLLGASASAQSPLLSVLGANHPELSWSQIETEHFIIIYHNGLDTIALKAAPIAEEVYRVVTTNLHEPLTSKVKIYFSDFAEVKNAFAFDDDHIFIWLRGILDDLPFGLRSSGNSKWLRSVLTHEFTHIVVAHATKNWYSIFVPTPEVPRWFNEGLARYMEPDGWTTDLDALLRVAAVTDGLSLGFDNNYFTGAMIYEGGQSLIRHIAATYGNAAIDTILHYRKGLTYDFEEAVNQAVKKKLPELIAEWHKRMTVYYASGYGQKKETEEFASKIPTDLKIILAAKLSPDGSKLAVIGSRTTQSPYRAYIVSLANPSEATLICDDAGIEPSLSWYRDSRHLAISKLRFGTNGDLVHDIYRLNIEDGSSERLTSDGRFEEPVVSPSTGEIVAVHTVENHSDLQWILHDGRIAPLTAFNDPNVQVYSPAFSHDGKKVAFSIFRANGKRDIATIEISTGTIRYITNDSLNNRSPIWSPDDKELLFISHRNGVPNLYKISSTGGQVTEVTDVAGAIYGWDWSKEKDSLLTISYDSRDRIAMYWVSARQTVTSKAVPELSDRYTAWRTIHFPLLTRPADSLTSLSGLLPSSYNSLAHISPLLLFPIIASDRTPSGSDGVRLGFIGAALDPMGKHFFSWYADYGLESENLGGQLFYINNQLSPSISLLLKDLYGYQRSIDYIPYFERNKELGLTISQVFTTPNSLTTFHTVTLGAKWRSLRPAVLKDFIDTIVLPLGFPPIISEKVEPNHQPIAFDGVELGIGYGFTSPLFIANLNVRFVSKTVGSKLFYSRYDLFLAHRLPFDEDRTVYIGSKVKIAAQLGSQIPQEYLGFTSQEIFDQGYNFAALTPTSRLRGIRKPYYGDRMYLGNEELVFAPRQFAGGASFVVFFDYGTVWYNKTPNNFLPVQIATLNKTKWLNTSGLELRIGSEETLTIAYGVGWDIQTSSHPDWYFRINTAF